VSHASRALSGLVVALAAFGLAAPIAPDTPTSGLPDAGRQAAAFTALPIDLGAVERINPLGHMTTPFNALPEGRSYIVLRDRTLTNPVYAPATVPSAASGGRSLTTRSTWT
jgi:hypothetical protein